jgi:hypothetical protein
MSEAKLTAELADIFHERVSEFLSRTSDSTPEAKAGPLGDLRELLLDLEEETKVENREKLAEDEKREIDENESKAGAMNEAEVTEARAEWVDLSSAWITGAKSRTEQSRKEAGENPQDTATKAALALCLRAVKHEHLRRRPQVEIVRLAALLTVDPPVAPERPGADKLVGRELTEHCKHSAMIAEGDLLRRWLEVEYPAIEKELEALEVA